MKEKWIEVDYKGEFWKPKEKGEVIVGMIVGKEKGDFGNTHLIAISEGDLHGELIKTPCHKVLQNKLDQLKTETIVRITYKGKEIREKGNDVEIYKVEQKIKEEE